MRFLYKIHDGEIMDPKGITSFSDHKIGLYAESDGEIYNSDEIRNQLRQKGYKFEELDDSKFIRTTMGDTLIKTDIE